MLRAQGMLGISMAHVHWAGALPRAIFLTPNLYLVLIVIVCGRISLSGPGCPGWAPTLSDPPASASQVLRLLVSTTCLSRLLFNWHVIVHIYEAEV